MHRTLPALLLPVLACLLGSSLPSSATATALPPRAVHPLNGSQGFSYDGFAPGLGPVAGLAQPGALPPPPSSAAGRVLTDQAEDGTIWVRGDNYKLALGQGGAIFLPREREAIRSHRLELAPVVVRAGGALLALDDRAVPTLNEREAVYERGALTELWSLYPGGARQNFVLHEAPPSGELVLRIAIAGDLAPQPDADEPTFRSPDGATVRYGNWKAWDARGLALSGPSVLVAGNIELRLSATYLAQVAYPLWIDPLISTNLVDPSAGDEYIEDIAIDDSMGRILTVHTEEFTKGDHDIIARRYTAAAEFIDEVAVDISTEYSVSPAVANHEAGNQFLVVWEDLTEGPYQTFRIRGRARDANSGSQATTLTIHYGDGAGVPDVGGPSSASTKANYYVTWSEYPYDHSNTIIAGRTVAPGGVLGNREVLGDANVKHGRPRVSKRSGTGGRYMVNYTTDLGNGVKSVDAAIVAESGEVIECGLVLTKGVFDHPDVDGDGTEFLTVFDGLDGEGSGDIYGVRTTVGTTIATVPLALSFAELTPDQRARHQTQPIVSRTKSGFTYAYRDASSPSAFDAKIFAASVSASTAPLQVTEKHVLLSLPKSQVNFTAGICNGLLNNRSYVVWSQFPSDGGDTVLGIYDAP